MEISLKNKCCLYVIISIRFFSITICNLFIDFISYCKLLSVLPIGALFCGKENNENYWGSFFLTAIFFDTCFIFLTMVTLGKKKLEIGGFSQEVHMTLLLFFFYYSSFSEIRTSAQISHTTYSVRNTVSDLKGKV